MIGKRLSSLAEVLCRHDVQVFVSEQLISEIRGVIARDKFDKLISAETRYYFFQMVYDICQFADITVDAQSEIRDPKDVFLLSLAESVPVDYIVSGDRDLTDLKQHAGIPILKYSELLEKLNIK